VVVVRLPALGKPRDVGADQWEDEGMTHRPEDRNATEWFRTFGPDGATLADLEEAIRVLRQRRAPSDAHPEIKTNEHHEIVSIVCVTERADAWWRRITRRASAAG
jgi:hypothetical protein